MAKKEIGKLVLIWVLTNFTVTLFGALVNNRGNDIVEGVFMFFIISSILSIPALLFFTILSYRILKSQKNVWWAKMIMIGINYIDIILTLLVLIFTDEREIAINLFIPLMVISTCWILIVPVKPIESGDNSQHD